LNPIIEKLALLSLDCPERLLMFVVQLFYVVEKKLINFDLEISVRAVVPVK